MSNTTTTSDKIFLNPRSTYDAVIQYSSLEEQRDGPRPPPHHAPSGSGSGSGSGSATAPGHHPHPHGGATLLRPQAALEEADDGRPRNHPEGGAGAVGDAEMVREEPPPLSSFSTAAGVVVVAALEGDGGKNGTTAEVEAAADLQSGVPLVASQLSLSISAELHLVPSLPAAPLQESGSGGAAAPPPLPRVGRAEAEKEASPLDVGRREPEHSPLLSIDICSASSVGGHHLSLTEGSTFLKLSGSHREEHFYAVIRPYQEALVRTAVHHAPRTIKNWRRRIQIRGRRQSDSGEDSAEDGEAAASTPPVGSTSSTNPVQTTTTAYDDAEELHRSRWSYYQAHEAEGMSLLTILSAAPPPAAVESASSCRSHGTETAAGAAAGGPRGGGGGRVAQRVLKREEKEAVAQAALLWWTLRPQHFYRGASAAYELQRRLAEEASCALDAVDANEGELSLASVDPLYAAQRERSLQLLASFVPRFFGTRTALYRDVLQRDRECSGDAAAAASSSRPNSTVATEDAETAEKGGVCQMIVLEYVCYQFHRPCVMDIKMGSRQYGLRPSVEKKRSKERKAAISTSARYGIRMAGFRRWNAAEGQYEHKSKLQCRCMTLNAVKDDISAFLQHNRELERIFRRQLQRLRVAFSQQTIFRFYTSSLLFVYDAADPLSTARVVMVDFAYTYESRELVQSNDPDAEFAYDVGYLKAIDTLLSLLA